MYPPLIRGIESTVCTYFQSIIFFLDLNINLPIYNVTQCESPFTLWNIVIALEEESTRKTNTNRPHQFFQKKKKDDKFKFLTGLKQVILKLLKLKTTKTSCTINLSVRKLFFYFLQKGTLSYHQTPFQYPSHKKALYFTITLQHLLQNSRNNFLIKDQICAGLYFFTNFTSAFQ